jgi:hypothetical protein
MIQAKVNNKVTATSVFRVNGAGTVYGVGAFQTAGADYSEYFEWADGNPADEDRVGRTVVLAGGHVALAGPNADPIGVVSATPSVVGDAAWSYWKGRYLRDEFGRVLTDPVEMLEWTDESGASYSCLPTSPAAEDAPSNARTVVTRRPRENPAYDPTMEYVPREDRREWACVGLVGKLRVRAGEPVGSRWILTRLVTPTVNEYLVR